jgi:hypothetical protein
MADAQLVAAMPLLTLDAGCTVTFEAIDPTNGATVDGAAITQATIYAMNVAESTLPPAPVPRLALDSSAGGPGGT